MKIEQDAEVKRKLGIFFLKKIFYHKDFLEKVGVVFLIRKKRTR